MKAKELSGKHLGKTVTVDGKGMAVAGTLAGVHHQGNIISEHTFAASEPTYSLGRQQVHLSFLNGSTMVTEPDADVVILDT